MIVERLKLRVRCPYGILLKYDTGAIFWLGVTLSNNFILKLCLARTPTLGLEIDTEQITYYPFRAEVVP
jgi:hypothetical protein